MLQGLFKGGQGFGIALPLVEDQALIVPGLRHLRVVAQSCVEGAERLIGAPQGVEGGALAVPGSRVLAIQVQRVLKGLQRLLGSLEHAQCGALAVPGGHEGGVDLEGPLEGVQGIFVARAQTLSERVTLPAQRTGGIVLHHLIIQLQSLLQAFLRIELLSLLQQRVGGGTRGGKRGRDTGTATQLLQHLLRAFGTFLRVHIQHILQERGQFAVDTCIDLRGGQEEEWLVAWIDTGQQIVQQRAQAIDIGAGCALRLAVLFRSRVAG